MDDLGFYLIAILFFTGVGFLFALPVLIPPLRRWLRGNVGRRITAVLLYGFFIFLLLFLVISQLGAQVQVVFFCLPVGDTFEHEPADGKQRLKQVHFSGCTYEDAIRLGYPNEDELKAALAQELFKRSITPPPFRQACYHDNLAFCDYADRIPTEDGSIEEGSYLLTVLFYLWTPVVTGFLIWRWTRPKEEGELVGGDI